MRTHASFRGEFPDDEADDDPPGRLLADLVANHLTHCNFRVSDREPTEYSHTFRVSADSRSFEVMVGAVAEEDCPWLLFVESCLFPFARWFGWRDREQHLQVLRAIHNCLAADERISDLRWYTADEWNAHPEAGVKRPDE